MSADSKEEILRLLKKMDQEGALGDALQAIHSYLTRESRLQLWPHAASEPPDLKESKIRGRFGMVGEGPAMRAVYAVLEKIVPSDLPVLIQGESGTGKELVARALHQYGPRKHRTYLSQNCAAIPETLLEAELFGHKKGAFTGAVSDRKGRFLAADGGTLFLDEIGDMPASMQAKLLRVLQDGELRPVGDTQTYHVDVRVLAASNKNLQQLVQGKEFREDLFYRLNVFTISLPPLRDRKEDVPLLVDFFARKVEKEMGNIIRISADAVNSMQSYRWPGNIRELENEIRRGAALTGGKIEKADLRPEIQSSS